MQFPGKFGGIIGCRPPHQALLVGLALWLWEILDPAPDTWSKRDSSRMRTARLLTMGGRGCLEGYVCVCVCVCVCMCVQGACIQGMCVTRGVCMYSTTSPSPWPIGRHPHVDRQTLLKTLLCPKCRLLVVMTRHPLQYPSQELVFFKFILV